MAEKVIMPKLGATMEEGTIDSWVVEIGDEVEEGDPIVEIQTDKITMEIEAESTGILLKKLYEIGDVVPVQQVIAYIGEVGEKLSEEADVSEETHSESNEELEDASDSSDQAAVAKKSTSDEKIRRTPAANRLSKEEKISLDNITGTGPLGRIQKHDVEHYISENAQKVTPLAKKMATDQHIDLSSVSGTGVQGKIGKQDILNANRSKEFVEEKEEKRVPFKGIRKVIASRISESFYTAPHVTLNSEVDVTEVVNLRKQLLPIIEEAEGVRVSYNEIILKAASFSLKKNPAINISLKDEKEIIYHDRIDIGMAVAVPNGLVVPVLRDVDQKGLAALTKEAKSMAKAARDGELPPEDMNGSTFTISNLGMYAVDDFTPIINQPNAAILGVGQIVKKPIVVDDEIRVRSMMTFSLSFDHRIVDGAPAAQFLTDIKDVLEHPYKLMV